MTRLASKAKGKAKAKLPDPSPSVAAESEDGLPKGVLQMQRALAKEPYRLDGPTFISHFNEEMWLSERCLRYMKAAMRDNIPLECLVAEAKKQQAYRRKAGRTTTLKHMEWAPSDVQDAAKHINVQRAEAESAIDVAKNDDQEEEEDEEEALSPPHSSPLSQDPPESVEPTPSPPKPARSRTRRAPQLNSPSRAPSDSSRLHSKTPKDPVASLPVPAASRQRKQPRRRLVALVDTVDVRHTESKTAGTTSTQDYTVDVGHTICKTVETTSINDDTVESAPLSEDDAFVIALSAQLDTCGMPPPAQDDAVVLVSAQAETDEVGMSNKRHASSLALDQPQSLLPPSQVSHSDGLTIGSSPKRARFTLARDNMATPFRRAAQETSVWCETFDSPSIIQPSQEKDLPLAPVQLREETSPFPTQLMTSTTLEQFETARFRLQEARSSLAEKEEKQGADECTRKLQAASTLRRKFAAEIERLESDPDLKSAVLPSYEKLMYEQESIERDMSAQLEELATAAARVKEATDSFNGHKTALMDIRKDLLAKAYEIALALGIQE